MTAAANAIPRATLVEPRPIIVYDGNCAMCRRQIRRVEHLDWLNIFATLEYDRAIHIFPEVARGNLGDGIRVRFPDTSVVIGVRAIRSICLRMPLTFGLGLALFVPPLRIAAERIYARIAARRHCD